MHELSVPAPARRCRVPCASRSTPPLGAQLGLGATLPPLRVDRITPGDARGHIFEHIASPKQFLVDRQGGHAKHPAINGGLVERQEVRLVLWCRRPRDECVGIEVEADQHCPHLLGLVDARDAAEAPTPRRVEKGVDDAMALVGTLLERRDAQRQQGIEGVGRRQSEGKFTPGGSSDTVLEGVDPLGRDFGRAELPPVIEQCGKQDGFGVELEPVRFAKGRRLFPSKIRVRRDEIEPKAKCPATHATSLRRSVENRVTRRHTLDRLAHGAYAPRAVQKFSLDNKLKFSKEHAWDLLADPEFQRRMYLEGLGFESIEVPAFAERNGMLERVLKAVPKVDLPGPVRKVLGERFGYEEHQHFDRAKDLWTWRLVIPTVGDRLRISGDIRIRADGDGACVRTTNFEIEAKIFGVGGLLEKTTKKETLQNYEKSAAFLNAHGPSHTLS